MPGLAARLPGLAQPRESDPDTERYLLWGAVVGLLREASGAEPLVLVLDDLHWADKPTLLLLKYPLMEGGGCTRTDHRHLQRLQISIAAIRSPRCCPISIVSVGGSGWRSAVWRKRRSSS